MLLEDLHIYWPAFKQSKWMDYFGRARQMETLHVAQEDFHQFRILGVGGFGGGVGVGAGVAVGVE